MNTCYNRPVLEPAETTTAGAPGPSLAFCWALELPGCALGKADLLSGAMLLVKRRRAALVRTFGHGECKLTGFYAQTQAPTNMK